MTWEYHPSVAHIVQEPVKVMTLLTEFHRKWGSEIVHKVEWHLSKRFWFPRLIELWGCEVDQLKYLQVKYENVPIWSKWEGGSLITCGCRPLKNDRDVAFSLQKESHCWTSNSTSYDQDFWCRHCNGSGEVYALGLEEVLLGFTRDATVEWNLNEVNDKVRWEGNEREVGTWGQERIVCMRRESTIAPYMAKRNLYQSTL